MLLIETFFRLRFFAGLPVKQNAGLISRACGIVALSVRMVVACVWIRIVRLDRDRLHLLTGSDRRY